MKQNKPVVIGITGGVGAGKSQVLELLAGKYGAYCIQLDEIGRNLLDIGEACYEEVKRLFGPEIVRDDGTLDRAVIAGIIFRDEPKRLALDGIIHPRVRQRTEELLRAGEAAGKGFIVIEAALLLEEHYDEICREVWYIYADEAVRARRLAETRGYSRERIRRMMDRQMPDAEFRRRCDAVICNNASFEETEEAVDREMKRIRDRYL